MSTRTPCPNPSICGVSFHIEGTASAAQCGIKQSASRFLQSASQGSSVPSASSGGDLGHRVRRVAGSIARRTLEDRQAREMTPRGLAGALSMNGVVMSQPRYADSSNEYLDHTWERENVRDIEEALAETWDELDSSDAVVGTLDAAGAYSDPQVARAWHFGVDPMEHNPEDIRKGGGYIETRDPATGEWTRH